jgi:hypothetical protein
MTGSVLALMTACGAVKLDASIGQQPAKPSEDPPAAASAEPAAEPAAEQQATAPTPAAKPAPKIESYTVITTSDGKEHRLETDEDRKCADRGDPSGCPCTCSEEDRPEPAADPHRGLSREAWKKNCIQVCKECRQESELQFKDCWKKAHAKK